MPDIGSRLPIAISPTKNTKEIKLKWASAQKIEMEETIKALESKIRLLKERDIPNLEADILLKKQELVNTITESSKLEQMKEEDVIDV